MSFITSKEKQTFNDRMTNCACCGKPMRVQSRQAYAYKAVNKSNFVRYFCSWKCMNAGCTEISESKRE